MYQGDANRTVLNMEAKEGEDDLINNFPKYRQ